MNYGVEDGGGDFKLTMLVFCFQYLMNKKNDQIHLMVKAVCRPVVFLFSVSFQATASDMIGSATRNGYSSFV